MLFELVTISCSADKIKGVFGIPSHMHTAIMAFCKKVFVYLGSHIFPSFHVQKSKRMLEALVLYSNIIYT